jgi:hypothetical protein
MSPSLDIRQLYLPVQPTVCQNATSVTYQEFLPEAKLQEYIYCYWQLKTREKLQEPFIYRVVADGCIDIFFELDNPQENFVMGFCKTYTEFPLTNSFNYIGIRFLPTMFPLIFNINALLISNRFAYLRDIVPATSNFITSHFAPTQDIENIKSQLDTYFVHLLSKVSLKVDKRFYNAIYLILKNLGTINVEKDLDTGVSPRQMRRLFEYYIGDTAKIFSQVVRFQHILNAKPSKQSLKQNKLFFDVGYYDQAHFIKEFKNFYGVTPSQAFGR